MSESIQGLTSARAEELRRQGRGNAPAKNADGGVWTIVRRNVFTLFNLLNIALAVLLVLVGSYRNLLFLGVVVSNALIGLVQELRAKRTHDRLRLLSEGKITALRDGRETLLAPEALVLGDVVILRRGDQTPADAEVIEGAAELNESLLTGESEPVAKQAGDTLLSGSFLTEGTVTARLTAVGAESFAGRLQQSARRVKRPTSELMTQLRAILRVVSIALVPIGAALYCKQRFVLGMTPADAVPKAVAAMLGMIPEGLVLLTSVALALGVVRLGKRSVLVNELYGIESLARVDVLCLDKTGTLTSGEMTVKSADSLDGVPAEGRMAAFMAAFPQEQSPTWAALRARFQGENAEAALETVPFSSDRKWSAARFEGLGTLVLGAPEKTLPADSALLKQAQALAAEGLRVMALLHGEAPLRGRELPEGLTPAALIALGDTLRPSAADTLRYFGEQGVALKVISGDSPLTVSRVARDAGLPGAEKCVDCSALQSPDYDALARDYTVFGRVSPEDKRELVLALKRAGHSVAMTGDGVNDVPALKAADCSIAMAGGSDAASRVAQVTLLTADFSVMPDVVLEGRRVINNITRAASLFLIKNLFSALLAVVLLALPLGYPFAPIQLTLISSLTIGFPSFVLAFQPSSERVSGRFMENVLRRALPGGLAVALLCVAALLFGTRLNVAEAELNTLCTLIAAFSGVCVLADVCRPFNPLRAGLLAVVAAGLLGAVLLFPGVFYLTALTGAAKWMLPVALALTPLLLWGLSLAVERLWRPRAARQAGARA
ncbi:MAG: HAD-IC family P-type ATPase [Eubacteriales bacterium]|nr:HAD-IC family P-type ATPase [Eubacteriales bacterium]